MSPAAAITSGLPPIDAGSTEVSATTTIAPLADPDSTVASGARALMAHAASATRSGAPTTPMVTPPPLVPAMLHARVPLNASIAARESGHEAESACARTAAAPKPASSAAHPTATRVFLSTW